MSSPKLIIHDDNKKKSVPINITSKSVPVESKLDSELDLGKSPPKVQTSLYKTEKCRSWITTGMCKYGNKCQFAHGRDELRPVMRHPKYKTQTCKTFSRDGFCPYGSRCRFIHPGEIQKNVVPQEYYIEDSENNEIAMSPMSPSLSTSMFALQIESPSNGNSLFGGTSKSNLMNNNGTNNSSTLLSSSLPTFTDNWMNNNNPQFNWNQQQQHPNKQMNSPFNTSKEFNDSQQDSFYDPFNLHENGNSNGSSKPKRDSSLFSKNHLFSPSSPSSIGNSQFQFSPSPSHHQGIFNLSNPTLTSPSQKSMFSFDDEQDLNQTPLKVRTKSTSDLYKHNNITSSPKEQFPLGFVKSQPTKIPTSGSPITNHNNTSPSSDSKSRLPIFTSLAN